MPCFWAFQSLPSFIVRSPFLKSRLQILLCLAKTQGEIVRQGLVSAVVNFDIIIVMGSVQSSLDAQSVYDKSQLMQMLSAFISRGSGDGLKGLALQGINLSDSTTSILIAGFSILFAIVIAFLFKNRGGGARGSQTDIGSAQSRDVDMGETQQDLCDEEKRKEVTVLFGTQTGTAERFAKSIVEEGNSRYRGRKEFKAICLQEYAEEGSQYGKKLSKASLVIFTMATYGDGEPTDDANNFYNWITSDEQAEVKFPELVYAVFGLGNRQYEHFNKVGTTIYNCLKDKGAKPLLACGLGDDDKMIEDDFSQWKEELWVELDKILGASDEDSYTPVIPKYRIVVHQNDTKLQEDNNFHKTNGEAIHDARNPFRAIVSERRELHKPESDRSCTHLEFDIAGSGLSYEAGDHVGVFAENCGEIVEAMAQCLGQPLDLLFTLYSEDEQGMPMPGGNSLPPPFPGPCTLRTALFKYADLLNSPRKESLRALAEYAADPSEKDRLNYLCSKEGREEYGQWIFASQRSLLEVLLEFPSVKVPLEVFFAAVAPRLQPRFYSISSSPNFVGNRVHVTCALVHEPTPTGRIHQGVCSTWMKNSTPASEGSSEACSSAPIFVRQSNFKLPKDPKLPIIMIGPGTGLAPFRGFLQERAILLQSGVELGPAILYFGCRNRKFDFIYEEELNGFVESGVLSKLNVAFSREGPQKEYVQHLLAREGGEIWKLLSEGAYFYVCGDAKSMAKDVHKTLLDIIEKHKSGDGQSAESILNSIQTEGRYLKDVW